ncbi:YeeE/YedE family protein [Pseudorhodobacter sp. E13]|uniref:YeeE/YedE family protein n=1 Tax=Pseudorhodobacter sp. E13 TaxID=2487931 RepID=UPI000F8CE6BE|nr:YeeE/YedE thiosulfate transporter family protein [Pseudorhodobacter sp. E13]RUS60679.1 YeeE/YedE family protein [Pseudorhodobacter sp. E13]
MEMAWVWGLVGGLMIGSAAALFLLVNGRIMGASGILGGLVDGSGRATGAERLAFIAGLVLLPALLAAIMGGAETNITSNPIVIIAAGLLVGIGTRLANGCTSGHGVCGISRLSFRGIVATVFYLLAGGMMMVLFRHVFGVI